MTPELMHDLREPLQAIYSCAQMLKIELDGKNPKAVDYADMLINNAVDLGRMLSNTAEAGSLDMEPLNIESVDISELVKNVANSYGQMAATKSIRIGIDLKEEPLIARVDKTKIMRILRNLISNAISHTPRAGRVEVRLRIIDDGMEIKVYDGGRGVDPGMSRRIFERFETTGGTGLGLYIANTYARMHGGTITVESTAGIGSAFVLYLPFASEDKHPQRCQTN